MNLGIARIREARAAFVRAPDGRRIRLPRVRRQVEDVAKSARRQDDGVSRVPREFAGDQVANDDPLGLSVHDHQIQHLTISVQIHRAGTDHS